MHFSFFMFFSVSRHIPDETVCLIFLVFQVFRHNQFLQCVFVILNAFQGFLTYSRSEVCVSNFACFSVFLPSSRSYSVYFSFFTFFSVSSNISSPTVCVFILHAFQFSRHLPGLRVYIYHFSCFQCFFPYSRNYHVSVSFFFTFLSFLAIIQVLQRAFLTFQVIQCFSPYSMSNSVCV